MTVASHKLEPISLKPIASLLLIENINSKYKENDP